MTPGAGSTAPRTIVIVGATAGVGFATARALHAQGHRLILAGRSPDRVATLQDSLPDAFAIRADISTKLGVRDMTREVLEHTNRIDTLINCAGVMRPGRDLSADGIELNRAVHHLAPHRAALQLLPALARGDGRVVNINSEGHRGALFRSSPVRIDFSDLNNRDYDPFLTYSRTKLANLLDTFELARRHPTLTVIAVHPGMVRTDLGRSFPRAQVAAMHAISISARRAAQDVAYLATQSVERGAYYHRRRPTSPAPAAQDQVTATALWEITDKL